METAALGLIVPIIFILIFFVVIGSILAFWIWMLVDCIQTTPDEGNQRLCWILIVVLTGWIGALIYLLVQRPKNRAAMPPPVPRSS